MGKFIEQDLKCNPEYFSRPRSGKYIDIEVIRHVIANTNKPENVSNVDFIAVLKAVTGEVDMIPGTDVGPYLISPISLSTGDTVYLEMYNHSTGRNFITPVTVEWLDDAGVCFVDDAGFGIYNTIANYHAKNTFGWRCWNLYPSDTKRKDIPWI